MSMILILVNWIAKRTGLSTIVVQIALVVLIAGSGVWWLKWHDAKQYDITYRKAELESIEKQRKIFIKEWDALNKKIEDQKKAYEDEKRLADEALSGAIRDKERAESAYKTRKAQIVTEIKEIPIIVEKIPASELVDEIRNTSAKLANIPKIEKTGIFTEQEERLVETQLLELDKRRTQVAECELSLEDIKRTHSVVEDAYKLKLTAADHRSEILEKEKDVLTQQVNFYTNAYKVCTKKRTKLCWFKKIISVGTWKCQ